MFNQYGLKGTFHLNSGTLDTEGFVTKGEIRQLYQGHEVACHGVEDKYLNHLPKEDLISEVIEDRRNLEEYSNHITVGFSYPFGEYSESVLQCLTALGIQYARTVENTNQFLVPADFMRWHPTCHHNNVTDELIKDFLEAPEYRKLSLFYIWGHSFEFNRDNGWENFERVCKKLSSKEDVWYATNIQYKQYMDSMKHVVTSINGEQIYNPSSQILWLKTKKGIITLKSGETIYIEK